MRFASQRFLALLAVLTTVALVSCVTAGARKPAPAPSKLAPHNAVFDLEQEGLKCLWRQELGQLTDNRRLRDLYSTGPLVVVEAGGGEIHCLDADTGIWKATTVMIDKLDAPPTALGDRLALVVKNSVVLYDLATGAIDRPHPCGFPLTAQPVSHKGVLYLAGGDGKIARLSPDERMPEWLVSLRGPIFSRPTIAGEHLLAASPMGVVVWDTFKDRDRVRWSPKTGVRLSSGVAQVADRIYVGDDRGLLYSLDADTGEWLWQRIFDGPIREDLRVVGTDLLVLTDNPSLICLDAAGDRQQRWRVAGVTQVISVGRNAVYAAMGPDRVVAISRDTGEPLWSDTLPPDCRITGSEQGPTFFIADTAGSIVAFTELD
ncbi:MAG: PQQ-binding-like beta-propeller repeat protein [Candidatus Brocadiaceae bacterium]|nr:PQQ-binding-like beta-propeller repeat protein [Candidatus Brocadiaceae bacterium]